METKYTIEVNQQTIDLMDLIFGHIPISMVLTDAIGRILMLNDHYAEFLNMKKECIIGRLVGDVIPNTRLPIVLATGKAETSQHHVYANGVKSIVNRIPFFTPNGDVAGCLGIVLFESMEELQHLAKINEGLYTRLSVYQNELKSIYTSKYSFDDILGESAIIRKTKELAKRFALSKANILITGESGTGKELWAHAIHGVSQRKDLPLVSVNCGAIPENLLESELFGYEEGAFTGAKKGGKLGKFQLANGGTLFLDEIGDMPLIMQVKILRVLQEGEVEKVGGSGTEKVDVAIIAATNRNLEQMIKEGTFREDLYYRLNVLYFNLPSLREHPEDLELLISHFVTQYCNSSETIKQITPEAMEILSKYSWPGNIREVSAVVERLLVSTASEKITPFDLPRYICIATKNCHKDCQGGLDRALADVERDMITQALQLANGNKIEAARMLGIPRSRLYRKIEQYHLEASINKV